MKRLFPSSWPRLVSVSVALTAVIVLLAPCAIQATPYVVKLTQQGNNVVAVGNGSIDMTGLTLYLTATSTGSSLIPNQAEVDLGPTTPAVAFYVGLTGPTSFGSGGQADTAGGTGTPIAVIGSSTVFDEPGLAVPLNYVSDTFVSNSATWNNATFASLGVTPGTYTWTWGAGADQSFTLDAFTSVPEPAALGMFGFGLLLGGGFLTLRRYRTGTA